MRILIVADVAENLALLETMLFRGVRASVIAARSAGEAIERMDRDPSGIDLVLVDLDKSGTHRSQACSEINVQADLRQIPVVIVTAKWDSRWLQEAFDAGACDYIVKPLNPVEVIARVRLALKTKKAADRRLDRESELVAINKKLVASNQELVRLAAVDTLTGVANRRCFDETLDRVWRSAARHEIPVALIRVDIDDFKAYNDHCGHLAAEDCLRRVAATLQKGVKRADDFVARYSGEEFAIILSGTHLPGAGIVADRLGANVESLDIPHPASPACDRITISQGLACAVPERGSAPTHLVQMADQALHQAKENGRNRMFHFGAATLTAGQLPY